MVPAFLMSAFVGLLSLLCLNAAIATPLALPIHQARQQPDGAEVLITGRVTVPDGLFESANLDKGFAIQDSTGGIYISTTHSLNLDLDEPIEVDGVLRNDGHGQRIVKLKAWHHRDRSSSVIAPTSASLREAGRRLDGVLVTVQGRIIRPLQEDAPYGDRLWIEDHTGQIQIYIPKSTHIRPQQLPFLEPGRTIRVTGFSSQYDDNDEVIPRLVEDIEAVE